MVEEHLRSLCKNARQRLADIQSRLREHQGRGLMVIHYDRTFHIAVVPEALEMKNGLLVLPCPVYLSAPGSIRADALELTNGPITLTEVSTHRVFFPDGNGRRVDFHVADPAFLAWYKRFGIRTLYTQVQKIAERLGHTIREEDLVAYRKEYELEIASQARGCVNRACVSAEKLYKGSHRDSADKERLLRELGMSRDELDRILTEAEGTGLDSTLLNSHRNYYRERLSTYD